MLPLSRRIALVAGCVTIAACGDSGGDGTLACTTEARAPVVLAVTDSAGTPLVDYAVTADVDGQSVTTFCSSAAACWVGPSEVSGDFVVTVSKAGYETQVQSVTGSPRFQCNK